MRSDHEHACNKIQTNADEILLTTGLKSAIVGYKLQCFQERKENNTNDLTGRSVWLSACITLRRVPVFSVALPNDASM